MGLRTGPQTTPYTGTAPVGSGGGLLSTDLGTMVSAQQYVHDVADIIYGEIQRLMTTIDGLSSNWRSPSASAYNNAMDGWNVQATELKNALYNIGDGLAHSHKTYNEIEENNSLGITQAANGLPY
jgi:WXG100 family type VII secretion target